VGDASEVRLVDVRAHPDVGKIGDRDDRRSRGHVFARLDVVGQHDASERRNEAGVFDLGFGEGDGGAGLFHAGAALGDVLGARPLLHELEALRGLDGVRFGHLELGLCRLEFPVRDGVLAAQLLLAGEFEPGPVAFGFGAAQRGGRGGDFLGPRPRLELGQRGFRGGEFRAPQRQLLLLFHVVEPGDKLARLDMIALGHGAFDHAARNLETELRVRHLDVAGNHQRARAAAARAGGQEKRGDGRRNARNEPDGAVRRRRVFHGKRGAFHSLCGRWM
jgi:hypothetical protein